MDANTYKYTFCLASAFYVNKKSIILPHLGYLFLGLYPDYSA